MPQSALHPALITRVEAAIAELETVLQELQDAIADMHAAFVQLYPPDETERWFAAWEEGRHGALWNHLERLDIQDVIDMALS